MPVKDDVTSNLSHNDTIAMRSEAFALRWVARRLGSTRHERRVLSNADVLFALIRHQLRLSSADRRLLRLAAIFHDVGRSISEKRHPIEGAELIMNARFEWLSKADHRALAFLTRYHRGAVAEDGHEEYLRGSDARRTLRSLLALLRVADALDSRQIESPEIHMHLDRGRLNVCCVVRGNVAEARRVYARRKKFRMLEQLLGHPITIHVGRKNAMVRA